VNHTAKAFRNRTFLTAFVVFIYLTLAPPLNLYAATLVHTNDIFGDIEPCGCRTNPLGGMARKINMLKGIKDPFVIQLDAGDLLFSSLELPDLLAEQSRLQAEFLLKSMDMTHHDAVVPGEKDYALGFKVFEELRKKSKIHFLAANLKKKNGQKYLDSHLILKGKDENGKEVKVAIFGLVGNLLPWPKELKALPPIAAAQAEVKVLRSKADFVVALTHEGLDEDEKLADKVAGIDVIIGGHSQSFLQTPKKVKNTLIYQSSFRNQYVGLIPLTQPMTESGYQLLGLDAGYDSPAGQPSEMDRLVVDFKKAIGDLNTRTALVEQKTAATHKFQTFTKCAECHLKQFDFWRQTQHAKALDTLVQKQQAKNKECLMCHTLGLGDPAGFQNISRLAEVMKYHADQDGEPEDETRAKGLTSDELNPLLNALHSAKTLDDKIDFKPISAEPVAVKNIIRSVVKSWTPVQCENCHLPGADHPFSGEYSKVVAKDTCLKCHNAERAPAWYSADGKPNWDVIDAKRKQVTCPAGEIAQPTAAPSAE
jgi:hypothetical protein